MKITALVENTGTGDLTGAHGLSLYVETSKHRLLFDLGPDGTLLDNAAKLGIDLSKVDTVVLSHGHYDHGGGLAAFLAVNAAAKVYVRRTAFAPHFSTTGGTRHEIGIDPAFQEHPQVVLLDGDGVIDEELRLFTVTDRSRCHSPANDSLLDEQGADTFGHEQNLVICDGKTVLLMGCGHCGAANILAKMEEAPAVCIGGYHLYSPRTGKTVDETVLKALAAAFGEYPETEFYTCHCTGSEAFDYFARRMEKMHYLACGGVVEV